MTESVVLRDSSIFSPNAAAENAVAMDDSEETEKRPFVLCELENLKHILHPLKSTQRIKYTCFGLSQKLLVFGATSGSLYIFKREPCTFLHLIPSKDGSISRVAISPDERIVAYATSKGAFVIIEHNVLQSSSAASKKLQVSNEHLGAEITAIQWHSDNSEVYIGDNAGRISLLCVSVFTAKNIFQTPSMQLMQLDSSITQMDFAHGLLLISTLTRCYLSDTEKEQYKQVGQKLRDGDFGACFVCKNDAAAPPVGPLAPPPPPPIALANSPFDLLGVNESLPLRFKSNLRIFCARPGSRLWEVNCDGSVISTHQFKEAIASTPPSKVITPSGQIGEEEAQNDSSKGSFNFRRLFAIGDKYILTYKSDGIFIFDPDNSVVVLWSNAYCNITDVQVWDESIYLWLKTGQMHVLSFQAVEKCILKLYFRKEYPICAQLCHKYLEHLMKIVPSARKLHFISDLAEKLTDHSDLRQNILPLTSEILKFLPTKQARCQKLKSGIYRIGHSADSDDEGKSFRMLRSLSGGRARKISDRSRSLSASPKRKSVHHTKDKEIQRNNSMQTLPAPNVNNNDIVHDSPFTLMSSPETIAALHDLTNILSNTLKKKWMTLEGKMKSFSQDVPLLDVGKSSKHNKTNENSGDGLEILIPKGRTEIKPTLTEPSAVDVSLVKEAIQRENYDQILQTCINSFDFKWNSDISKPFLLETLFTAAELAEIKKAFINSFETKFILNLLPSNVDAKLDEDYPEIFKSAHSDQDLMLDTFLSRLVTAFGEVLDEDRILEDIISLNLPCYFASWCAVLNVFQQQVLKFITSESRETIRKVITNKGCPLPRLLNVMYLLLRVSSNEGIDICLSIGENVTLKDFCYVVLKLQQHKIAAGIASQNIQRYCQNMLLSYLSKKSVDEDCFSNIHVYKMSLEAFVNLNIIQEEPNCSCGFPLPGSNRQYPLQFNALGSIILQYLERTNVDLYLRTCSKLSLWKNVIVHRLNSSSTVRDLLPLILQLDNILLFEELLSTMDEPLLEEALKIRKTLDDNNNCLNCRKVLPTKKEVALTWTYLGQCAVKFLGPDGAISLLSKNTTAEKTGLLKKSFFQSCIVSGLLSEDPSKAAKAVEIMQKKDETKQLFATEVSGRIMEALSKDLALQGVPPMHYMPPAISTDHHWGVQVRLWDQKCPRCSLLFADNVLLKEGGVRIFPCSHAFHVACLGESPTTCLQCKVSK